MGDPPALVISPSPSLQASASGTGYRPRAAAVEISHLGARWREGSRAEAVDLLALGSKPGQRKRLELPQVFEFGVLADDALGEFGAAGL